MLMRRFALLSIFSCMTWIGAPAPSISASDPTDGKEAEPLVYHRMPSAETIRNADKFRAPLVGEYAKKLAQQPDMMGLWMWQEPATSGEGPVFDPANAAYAPQPVAGEQSFGPMAGTYLKGIPYKPEYQKKYQALIAEVLEGKSRDTFAACEPYGMPRMLGDSAGAFDIVQSPEVMIWYDSYGRMQRRIFLDGRSHPSVGYGDEDLRTYSGHSVGHWEGQTLVVDTVNMFGGYYDQTPAPYSKEIRVVERLRLIDTNVLESQLTIIDPVMLERPWVVTRYFRRMSADWSVNLPSNPKKIVHAFMNLEDRPCIPNVKIDDEGFQIQLLPQEIEIEKAKPNLGNYPIK